MMGFQGSCLDRALPVICFIPVSIFLWVFQLNSPDCYGLTSCVSLTPIQSVFHAFQSLKAMKDSITEVYIGPVNPQILGDFHALLGASGCLV